jgi:hypothetical protein
MIPLGTTSPTEKFKLEARGLAALHGQTVKKPAPFASTAVTFRDTAEMLFGIVLLVPEVVVTLSPVI